MPSRIFPGQTRLLPLLGVLSAGLLGGCVQPPETRPIRLSEISDGKRLIGVLGRPMFSIVKVTGVLTDISNSSRKEAGDNIVLKVLRVDGAQLEVPVLIEAKFMGETLQFDDETSMVVPAQETLPPHVGKRVTAYAYETIRAEGTPRKSHEYFAAGSAVGESRIASHLVIMSDIHTLESRKKAELEAQGANPPE